jgi:hypothetical protein
MPARIHREGGKTVAEVSRERLADDVDMIRVLENARPERVLTLKILRT